MTMRKVDPKGFWSYLKRFLDQGDYRRLIGGRFFRATITSVTGVGPYLCGLQRTGEAQSDGGSYFCLTPGYAPLVGDDVECVWLDAKNAMILWPITPTGVNATAYLANAQSLVNNTETVVLLDTLVEDPSGCFDVTTNKGRYNVKVAGRYLLCGGWQCSDTNPPGLVAFSKNGSETKRCNQTTNTSGTSLFSGSAIIRAIPGDWLAMLAYQNAGATHTIQNGVTVTWMDVQYLSA